MDAIQARINAAKDLASILKETKALCAIVGGSVGRLTADQYSDLEIVIYYDILPNDVARKKILKELKAIQSFPFKSPQLDAWQIEDNVTIDELRIDFIHCKYSVLSHWLDRLLLEFDPHLGIQKIAASLLSGEILFGHSYLEPLKKRLNFYPRELALNTINQQLSQIGIPQLEIANYRQDIHIYYTLLSSQHYRILPIIFALNKQFYSGEKNLKLSTKEFKICKVVTETLFTLYELTAKECAEKFEDLIDIILKECKKEFLEIDDTWIKRKRTYKRTSWPSENFYPNRNKGSIVTN